MSLDSALVVPCHGFGAGLSELMACTLAAVRHWPCGAEIVRRAPRVPVPRHATGHEGRRGDHVFVGLGTGSAGRVAVGSGVVRGAGCISPDSVTMGAESPIAAAAVVVADVPAGARLGGVPA